MIEPMSVNIKRTYAVIMPVCVVVNHLNELEGMCLVIVITVKMFIKLAVYYSKQSS